MDLDAFAHAVADLNAEVVGLQEVDDAMLRSRRADMTSLAATLSNKFGYFGNARRRWDLGRFGNALLLPQGASSALATVRLPRHGIRRERRCAVLADVRIDETVWHVATAHLSLYGEESADQLAFLLKLLAQRSGPKVLMGDFNRKLAETEPIASEHGFTVVPSAPTYPSWGPDQIIDFVLIADATHVSAEVKIPPISDHCALVVELLPA